MKNIILVMLSIIVLGCELQNVQYYPEAHGWTHKEFEFEFEYELNSLGITLTSDDVVWRHYDNHFEQFGEKDTIYDGGLNLGYRNSFYDHPVLKPEANLVVQFRASPDVSVTLNDSSLLELFDVELYFTLSGLQGTVGSKFKGDPKDTGNLIITDSSEYIRGGDYYKEYVISFSETLCSGYYRFGYDITYTLGGIKHFRYLSESMGNSTNVHSLERSNSLFIDHNSKYCYNEDDNPLDSIDVEFESGKYTSSYNIASNERYPYWETIVEKGQNINMMVSTHDSTLILSSIDFLTDYANLHGNNLDSLMVDLLLQDSLNLDTALQIYDVDTTGKVFAFQTIPTGLKPDSKKGALDKYFVYNDYEEFYKKTGMWRIPDNHLVISHVGQELLIRIERNVYMLRVIDINSEEVGAEKVTFRVYY